MVRGSGGRACEREKTRRDDEPQNNNDENIMAKKIASLVSPPAWLQTNGESRRRRLPINLESAASFTCNSAWLCPRPLISITALLQLVAAPNRGTGRGCIATSMIYVGNAGKKVESLGPLCPLSLAANRISSSSVQCNGLHDEPPPRRLHAAPAHFLPLTGCQYSNNDELDKIQTSPEFH